MRQLFFVYARLACQNAEIVARESTALVEFSKQLFLIENSNLLIRA